MLPVSACDCQSLSRLPRRKMPNIQSVNFRTPAQLKTVILQWQVMISAVFDVLAGVSGAVQALHLSRFGYELTRFETAVLSAESTQLADFVARLASFLNCFSIN